MAERRRRPRGPTPPQVESVDPAAQGSSLGLTPVEIEMAEIANIPLEEYMRNKRELIRPNARNRNQMH